MNHRFLTAAALLGVFVTGGLLPTSLAHPQAHKKAPKTKTVYVCKVCKMYYSPSTAQKMSYKDPMGHKLVKMSSTPSGYKMGSMSKGKDKTTGKKEDDKETANTKQASTMKCPVCKTMDMTATKTDSNTQEVKIKGKTWYCCAGCDMSSIADKQ